MKTRTHCLFITLALLAGLNPLAAQGTAFTYQGRLNLNGAPANGSYDLTFSLFSSSTGGSPVPSPQTNSAVAISNGLFSVTISSLVGGVFNGSTYWLEIGVRTNGAPGFTTLASRQQITPTPYAIFAEGANAAGLSGTLPATSFSGTYGGAVAMNNAGNSFGGTFIGNGANVTNVNAAMLNGLAASNFWQLGGNAGTTPGTQFLGTTDNKALTVKVNNTTALQIVPGTTLPNVVGGVAAFRPSVVATGVSGAVIAGGNAPSGGVTGFGGGDFQAVYDDDGTVGGGFGNKVGSNDGDPTDAAFATVAGGVFNGASGYAATVAGGDSNTAGGGRSAVAGGFGNQITGNFSAVGGGQGNVIQIADHSVIAGGNGNFIGTSALYAAIGGGSQNTNLGAYAVVCGGLGNTAGNDADTVSGGNGNTSAGGNSTVGGGLQNLNLAASGTIGGGTSNTNLPGPLLGGGGTIGGGGFNLVTNDFATIPGGAENVAGGLTSFAAGYKAQALHDGTFVWADSQNASFTSTSNNQFLVRAQNGVGIGTGNPQGSLHVYSGNNPTIVRIQSTGTPGFGRIEFFSNPQGDVNEWRPAYIQSLDAGGFTGGLGFYVNGTGAANKLGSNEVMRIINGAVGIGNTAPGHLLVVGGSGSPAYCDGTTWQNGSDRNAKEEFAAISPCEVLAKVSALPITEWQYKVDAKGDKHLGPMAQDFHAAFGLNGSDDKHIATVDESGVALAAIQGLNRKLEEKESEIQELKQRLNKLEQLLQIASAGR